MSVVTFKIQHKNNQMFSSGGQQPEWTKIGKIWKSFAALRCHLAQFKPSDVTDWVVHRYSGTCDNTMPASELMTKGCSFKVELSKPLIELLNYARGAIPTSDDDFYHWDTLRRLVLGDLYHYDMTMFDVVQVVCVLYEEALNVPEFKIRPKMLEQTMCIKKAYNDRFYVSLFSVKPNIDMEFVCNAQLQFMLNELMFSCKSWCKSQLEEKK